MLMTAIETVVFVHKVKGDEDSDVPAKEAEKIIGTPDDDTPLEDDEDKTEKKHPSN
jgi:hypothetical protein